MTLTEVQQKLEQIQSKLRPWTAEVQYATLRKDLGLLLKQVRAANLADIPPSTLTREQRDIIRHAPDDVFDQALRQGFLEPQP